MPGSLGTNFQIMPKKDGYVEPDRRGSLRGYCPKCTMMIMVSDEECPRCGEEASFPTRKAPEPRPTLTGMGAIRDRC